jgi:WD40 repeat protein
MAMPAELPCPDDQSLERLALGRASGAEIQSLTGHLEKCQQCMEKLSRWIVPANAPDARPAEAVLPTFSFGAGAGGSMDRMPGAGSAETSPEAPAGDRSAVHTPFGAGSARPQRLPRIAGYELLSVLGRGGMGVVYQARHLRLNRLVALKMILAGSFATAEELARFRAEGEAVARLQHANIVQIFEVGEIAEADGPTHPYMALEYVDGGTLADKVRESPLPARASAGIVEVLARAIHYAHQRGVVHRDLKPGNVLLAGDGTPKITDFGLAKQVEAPDGQTQTGQIVGTPEYMAPEQAAGQVRAVGPHVDVYALGAILYVLVTGRPPFKAATTVETLEQVRQREPAPPGQLQPGLPRDLETICLKCLQKEPRKRYPSAEELADDLGRFLRGEPIKARPVSRLERAVRWCRRYPLAASLLALLGLALAGAIWGWGTAANERDATELQRQTTQTALTEVERQKGIADRATEDAKARRTLAELREKDARVAADLERQAKESLQIALYHARVLLADQYWYNNNPFLAEQKLDECPAELRGWEWRYLIRLCRGNVRTLRGHTSPVGALAYSADGRRLASMSGDDIVRVWDTGAGKELYASPRKHPTPMGRIKPALAFSPDGRLLALPIPFAGPQFMPEIEVATVVDVDTGKTLSTLKAPNGTMLTRLYFSPDGKQLAGGCENFADRVRFWDAATGRAIKALAGNPRSVNDLAYSPDGKLLATIGIDNMNKGSLMLWDIGSGKDTFTFTAEVFDELTCVRFSADGKRLAVCGRNSFPIRQKGILKVWDVETQQEAGKIPAETGPLSSLAFSPAGGRLAVTGSSDGTARVFDLKSGELVLSVTGRGRGGMALANELSFRPDSKWLAVAGLYNVKAWNLETKKEVLDFRGHINGVMAVAFSPDGRHLASAGSDYTVRIWDTSSPQGPLALRDGVNTITHALLSPDGEVVASIGHEPASMIQSRIKLWKAATGEVIRSLAGDRGMIQVLAYSPDGKRLASAGQQGVTLWNIATGAEVLMFKGHQDAIVGGGNSIAFSPDSKLVASTGNDGTLQVWSADNGQVVFRWEPPKMGFRFAHGVAFSADGKRLAAGFRHQEMKVFDMETRQPLCTIPHGVTQVPTGGLALSPDGRLLASISMIATAGNVQSASEVHVWDATTGKHLYDLRGHLSTLSGLSFSVDGRRLASASADGTVKLWDLSTRQEMLTLRGPWGVVQGVAFSGDGDRLIASYAPFPSAGPPGPCEIRIWDARPLAQP